jgi:hypothetical protein
MKSKSQRALNRLSSFLPLVAVMETTGGIPLGCLPENVLTECTDHSLVIGDRSPSRTSPGIEK